MSLQEKGTLDYQKAVDKRLQVDERYQQTVTRLNQQLVAQFISDWNKAVQPMQSALATSLNSMAMGTQTFHKSFQTFCQTMLKDFVSMCTRLLAEWVTNQLAQTSIAKSALAMKNSLTAAATAPAIAAAHAEAAGVIPAEAAIAAGGAAQSVASIPYVGPAMAAAAYAETMAMIMAGMSGFAVGSSCQPRG